MDAALAKAMRDALLVKMENEHKATLKVIEHLPDERLTYKPHEKVRTFGDLAVHIYATGKFFADITRTATVDWSNASAAPATPKTKKELLELCQRLNQETTRKIADTPGETLAKSVVFGNFGTYPALTFADWGLAHLVHHRGQLCLYLRTMGAKVPAVYGDSLDYPIQM